MAYLQAAPGRTACDTPAGVQGGAPVAARLLVGADGNASAVWEHLFPQDPLQYTGVSVWRTVIAKPPDWFETGTAVTWEGVLCEYQSSCTQL